MKMKLNKLPVKTTNGFQINDVEVEFNIPTFKRNTDVLIEGDLSLIQVKKEKKKGDLTSKIGLTLSAYENIQIVVPKGVNIKEPIIITYSLQKEDANISQIEIVYEENSSCDFVITTKSMDNTSCFQHLKEMITSQKNASGHLCFINQMNSDSQSFYSLENHLYQDSDIYHTVIDLGGKTRLYNVYSDLLEEQAKHHLNTIYIGKEDSLLDFNYYVNHIGIETESKMVVEGVLTDTSHKNFRGTIDFQKGCCKSTGEENENCILLSDTCRSRSLPQMLCGEEDVVGAHGVSSGKVEEAKLFYLMAHGYSEKEAEKLIVMGRFLGILDSVPSQQKEEILSVIEEKLS